MSEQIDINVGVINEEITITAYNDQQEVIVNAVSNLEDISITANTNLIEININTAAITIINPGDYDLSQFTNSSPNPFVQASVLAGYVPVSRTISINGIAYDLNADRSWIVGATWGSITGTLSSQTDLQTALNAKQNSLTLTTTGTSGAATLVGSTLNIPSYSISGLGGVPSSRTLTINGTTYDLSADRSWTIATGLTVGTTPISSGTVGRILFEGAGNVLQENANFTWDNTNNILFLGSLGTSGEIAFNRASTGTATGGIKVESSGAGILVGGGSYLDTILLTNGGGLRFSTWTGSGSGTAERMRVANTTGNILINTTTDAGYKLDVNGTARVQGVITGSLSAGSLTLGATSANQTAIAVTGYFTGNGAITTSNSNPRGFNANIGAQNTGITLTYNGFAQGQTVISSYFLVSGNINLVDGAIDLNGFNFTPTIVSEVGATIKAFSSSLSAASNHYNLYLSGGAKNYLEGSLLIGTSTDSGYKLDVNGTSRFSGITDFNQRVILNGNSLYLGANNGNTLLRTLSNNIQLYNNNAGGVLHLNANGSVQIGQTNVINWATFSASGHTIYGTTNTNFFSSGNIGVNTATDSGYKLDVNGTVRIVGAVYDSTSSAGTSGQVLSSTVTGTAWVTPATVTPAALTKTDDTNITLTLGGTPGTALLQGVSLTLGWTGTLADSRIASAATWNAKQDAITLTTTGTSGPATLIGNTLNIPQYGGGGGGGTIYKLTSQTLIAASWVLVGSYYTYTFSNANITTNTRVDFTPANASYTEVTTCGMLPQVDVAAGSCTFYSLFPPATDILGEVTIFPTV